MDLYSYEPLDPQRPTFRLLRLLRFCEDVIECEIYSTSLDDNVSYEALSYCWGSSDLVECIKLNGKDCWVTESLHTALRHLRLPNEERILWVDALCIHQADKSEQGHQVRQMGRIFGQASSVIFWLGRASFEICCLMESLDLLHNELGSYPAEDHEFIHDLWSGVVTRLPANVSKLTLRTGLEQLLQRPWFERVWIVQEVAAARTALLCCGWSSIPAELLYHSLRLTEIDARFIPVHVKPILEIMPGQRDQANSWWLQPRNLSVVLSKFASSKAADRRDMVYALLDIATDVSDPPGDFPIDYTKSVTEVYRDALSFIVNRHNVPWKDLCILLPKIGNWTATLVIGLPKVPSRADVFVLPLEGRPQSLDCDAWHVRRSKLKKTMHTASGFQCWGNGETESFLILEPPRDIYNDLSSLLRRYSTCVASTADEWRSQKYDTIPLDVVYFSEPQKSLHSVGLKLDPAWKGACSLFVRFMHDCGVVVADPSCAVQLIDLDGRKEVTEMLLRKTWLIDDGNALATQLSRTLKGGYIATQFSRELKGRYRVRDGIDPLTFKTLLGYAVRASGGIDEGPRRHLFRRALDTSRGNDVLPFLLENNIVVNLDNEVRFLCQYSWGLFGRAFWGTPRKNSRRRRERSLMCLHKHGAQNCLLEAVRMGWIDAAEKLLLHGADPNRYDPKRGNALWWAMGKGHPLVGGKPEIILLLQDYGAVDAKGPQDLLLCARMLAHELKASTLESNRL